jgi:predicted Zn-dependent protease
MAYLNSEAELAAVLGHEVGHVTARHGVRQQSASQAAGIGISLASIFVPGLSTQAGSDIANLLSGALLSGYGRDHELEADRLGAQYLARTSYDPQAMIRVVSVLKNQELFDVELAKQEGREPRRYHGTFATHPDNDTRFRQVVGEASNLKVDHPLEGKAEYHTQTSGLIFNDSEDEGVVRGNKFTHRDLGIELTFPPQWSVKNSPTQLIATNPTNDAAIELKVDGKPAGTPPEYARRLSGSSATIESLTIEKSSAAIASSSKFELGIVYLNGKAFLLQGTAKTEPILSAQRALMKASMLSFHALTPEERKSIKPLNIKLVVATAGDTYAKLALNSPLGKNAEKYLRLINAQYPQGEPVAGQTLKTIE